MRLFIGVIFRRVLPVKPSDNQYVTAIYGGNFEKKKEKKVIFKCCLDNGQAN